MKIFIIVIFTLFGLYNGLLVFIFQMEHDPFFINALLLFMASIALWFFQKKSVFRRFKYFISFVMVFTLLVSSFFTYKAYVIMTGLYLDGTAVIWVNHRRVEQEDSKRLKALLLELEEYNATVSSDEATYSLSYMGIDDLDMRHIHIFKKDKLIIKGCLLGVGKGDTLEGYLLTDEVLSILERQ